jgi:NADPH:quinone reductase
VQLAKLAGFGKIVVVGGQQEELRKFGATHVLDRHGGHDVVLGRVRSVVGDDLEYVYDAVSYPEEQALGINALSNSKRGKFARLIGLHGDPDTTKIHKKAAGYDVKSILGISHLKPHVSAPFWDHVKDYLIQENIFPLKYESVEASVENVNELLDRYRDNKPVVQRHFRFSE